MPPYDVESPLASGVGFAAAYLQGQQEKAKVQRDLKQQQLENAQQAATLGLQQQNAQLAQKQYGLDVDKFGEEKRKNTSTIAATDENTKSLKLQDDATTQGNMGDKAFAKWFSGQQFPKGDGFDAWIFGALQNASKVGASKVTMDFLKSLDDEYGKSARTKAYADQVAANVAFKQAETKAIPQKLEIELTRANNADSLGEQRIGLQQQGLDQRGQYQGFREGLEGVGLDDNVSNLITQVKEGSIPPHHAEILIQGDKKLKPEQKAVALAALRHAQPKAATGGSVRHLSAMDAAMYQQSVQKRLNDGESPTSIKASLTNADGLAPEQAQQLIIDAAQANK